MSTSTYPEELLWVAGGLEGHVPTAQHIAHVCGNTGSEKRQNNSTAPLGCQTWASHSPASILTNPTQTQICKQQLEDCCVSWSRGNSPCMASLSGSAFRMKRQVSGCSRNCAYRVVLLAS